MPHLMWSLICNLFAVIFLPTSLTGKRFETKLVAQKESSWWVDKKNPNWLINILPRNVNCQTWLTLLINLSRGNQLAENGQNFRVLSRSLQANRV